MEEIWKDIKDYEGYYQISNLGNVRSIERTVKRITHSVKISSKLLKLRKTSNDYFNIQLCKDSGCKSKLIHRLVAEAFIPNPENKPEVNHKDGNKANNNVLNLEWNTSKENSQHSYDSGLSIGISGINNKNSKSIIQLDMTGNTQNKFACAREAYQKTGVHYKHISRCCLGKRKSAGGYVWKFDN